MTGTDLDVVKRTASRKNRQRRRQWSPAASHPPPSVAPARVARAERCQGWGTLRLATALREHRHLRGPLVLSEPDGRPLARGRWCRAGSVVQHATQACRTPARLSAPHVLLASGDAGCPSLCHPRTGGTRGPLDDATVHPPESPAIEGAIRLLDDTKPDPVGGEIAEAEGRGSGSTVERTS